MDTTPKLGLRKPAVSDTFKQWLDAHNANADYIDTVPLPIEKGNNSQLSYMKFSDGTVIIWGAINYGTKYSCYHEWAPTAGYASDEFDINLPIPMVSETYAFIPHVSANVNPDMWFVTRTQTFTRIRGAFLCAIDERANPNTKILNIFIMGKWKN